MTESGVIDRTALDALLEQTGSEPSFLAELIDMYFDDTTQLLADMGQALSAASGAAVIRRSAHTLKSNSATFGAMRLAGLCEELEEMGRAGTLDGAAVRLAVLEVEYDKVKRALQAERPSI